DRVRFRVAHEGASFLVVEKPSGVSTQPGKGSGGRTLLNGLFARWGGQLQNLGAARDFGLLHRLDKDASGLVLVALTKDAYDAFRAQFEARTIEKRYWAVVEGRPTKPAGVVRRPILEVQGREKTAKVSTAGLPATTAYRVLDASRTASVLECRIGSGRLHQIRVHLASLKCPILGDRRYAPPAVAQRSQRLALHAFLLEFDDPDTSQRRRIVAPWPKDLASCLREARLRPPSIGGESTGEAEPTDETSRTEGRHAAPPEGASGKAGSKGDRI
ncbi:MAG: RluA family pseudouridine synthase, partial [Phycisphaerales bacterium]